MGAKVFRKLLGDATSEDAPDPFLIELERLHHLLNVERSGAFVERVDVQYVNRLVVALLDEAMSNADLTLVEDNVHLLKRLCHSLLQELPPGEPEQLGL